WVLTVTIVLGSALTVAYTLRFWWGAFGRKPDLPDSMIAHKPPVGFVVAPVVLGTAVLVAGFLGGPLTEVFTGYAETLPDGEHGHGLTLLPSWGLPLAASLVAIAGGALLFWQRQR